MSVDEENAIEMFNADANKRKGASVTAAFTSKVHVIEDDPEDADIDMDLTAADINRAFDPRTPALLKLRDKISFVAGVVNVFVLAFLLHGVPWFIPWYYMIKAPLLLSVRYYSYFKQHFQYFLIDFCYWANFLLLVQIIFFPRNKRLFTIAYAVSHGPLIWAVGLFKNSLVFHSVDKTISAFIHVSPYMVCYSIRWFHDAYPSHQRYDVCHPDDSECASFFWTAVVPLGFYICWFLVYGVVITFIFPVPDESYLTSYRYLTRKSGPLGFLRSMRLGWLLYAAGNVLVTFMFLCPVILMYRNQIFDFVFGGTFCLIAVWNGAGFYIEVFSKKYHTMIEKELQTK